MRLHPKMGMPVTIVDQIHALVLGGNGIPAQHIPPTTAVGTQPRRVGAMNVARPYPLELVRVARKVVWYDAPERTLEDVLTFLAHLMVYGSPADVNVVEKYMSREEFRTALANAPAGIFTQDAWTRWHEKLGIRPIPALPRRRFPDGSLGPEARRFLGR